MAIKKVRSTYLLLPGRQWFYRASLLMMLTIGVALMVMSKAGNPAVSRLRTNITDVVTPVLAFVASPMDAVHSAGEWISEMVRLREENIALKEENRELMKWQANAKSMSVENESLRTLLNVVPSRKTSYITVRMVSDLGGPYVHSALVNGGSNDGIHRDEAAINDTGLVGRVIDVGVQSSRVLLLNDINSRVPVFAEHAREKSILAGNNTDTPTLSYLSADSKIKVGERIVTSGDGGIFPQGIPVGMVTSIEKGVVKVQPFADITRTAYVSIVDYSF